MIFLALFLLVPLAVYILTVEKWRSAWINAPEVDSTSDSVELSVVIALHNEQGNVHQLLENLPSSEVIFVCDHCTDKTFQQLKDLTRNKQNVKVLENKSSQGKKFAQRFAVGHSTHNILLFTDADCKITDDWVKAIASIHNHENPDLVIAPVVMRGTTFLQHLFEIEFLSLQMSTAGATLQGQPVMCNGANLSVKKNIYLSHNPKTEYVSGDDMFLLSEVKRLEGKICYIKNKNALIETSTPASLSDFFRQRTRWLRKGTGYTDCDVIRCAQMVFWANIILLILPFISLPIFALAFLLKFFTDYRLLLAGSNFFRIRTDLPSTLILAILYPLMMLTVALLSLFRSKKKW